ncbi:MAG: hypothetical protein AB7O78_16880 [Thermoleophilia bacterium]
MKPPGEGNPAAWVYHADGGIECAVFGIRTTAAEVKDYQDAGDPIATNPDATASINTSRTGEVARYVEP